MTTSLIILRTSVEFERNCTLWHNHSDAPCGGVLMRGTRDARAPLDKAHDSLPHLLQALLRYATRP